jgi:hypothetical protein
MHYWTPCVSALRRWHTQLGSHFPPRIPHRFSAVPVLCMSYRGVLFFVSAFVSQKV